MTYKNDLIARYIAMRVNQNRADESAGIAYEKAITNTRTSKEAIDWWLDGLTETGEI